MGGDLLLRVFGPTFVTYPGAPRINVKRETEKGVSRLQASGRLPRGI
jgi:hypothetical protein